MCFYNNKKESKKKNESYLYIMIWRNGYRNTENGSTTSLGVPWSRDSNCLILVNPFIQVAIRLSQLVGSKHSNYVITSIFIFIMVSQYFPSHPQHLRLYSSLQFYKTSGSWPPQGLTCVPAKILNSFHRTLPISFKSQLKYHSSKHIFSDSSSPNLRWVPDYSSNPICDYVFKFTCLSVSPSRLG